MTEPTKRCTKCGAEKPLSAYHVRRDGAGGRHSQCKVCRAESSRKYRELHREELTAHQRECAAHNREKVRERNRKYRELHREEIAARRRKYYVQHREFEIERARKYRECNREKVAEWERQYYVRRRDEFKARRSATGTSAPVRLSPTSPPVRPNPNAEMCARLDAAIRARQGADA